MAFESGFKGSNKKQTNARSIHTSNCVHLVNQTLRYARAGWDGHSGYCIQGFYSIGKAINNTRDTSLWLFYLSETRSQFTFAWKPSLTGDVLCNRGVVEPSTLHTWIITDPKFPYFCLLSYLILAVSLPCPYCSLKGAHVLFRSLPSVCFFSSHCSFSRPFVLFAAGKSTAGSS